MSTAQQLLEQAGIIQQTAVFNANRISKIVAALQKQDKLILNETIKTLYHLSWGLKDLSDVMSEITQTDGHSDRTTDMYDILRSADTIEWKEEIIKLQTDVTAVHAALTTLCTELSNLGMELKLVPRFNARVGLDLHFLNRDIASLNRE